MGVTSRNGGETVKLGVRVSERLKTVGISPPGWKGVEDAVGASRGAAGA